MASYILYSLDWDKFRQLVERPTPGQLAALGKLLADGLEENDGEFEEDDPILQWSTDAKSLAQIAAQRLALLDWYGDLSRAGKNLWEGVIFNACMNCDDIDVGFRVDNDGVYWDVIELTWKRLKVVPNTITDVALSAFGTRPYRYYPRTKPAKNREEYDQDVEARRSSLQSLSNMLGQFMKDVKQGKQDPTKLFEQLEQQKDVTQEHKKAIKDFLSDEDTDDEDENESEEWTPMHSMHTPDEVQKMLTELRSVESVMKKTKIKDARRQYEEDLLPAIESVVRDGRMLFVQVDT